MPAIILTPVAVQAVSGTNKLPSETIKTASAETTVATTESEDTTNKTTERQARLETLKTTFKSKIDDATKKRVALKCKPAQALVGAADKVDKANIIPRQSSYKKIVEKVQKLIDRLKADGKDTAAIEAALTTLSQKIDAFNADVTAYQQTISDLKELDCTADPAAFQAALLEARTQRETARTAAIDIRTFINSTLKTALQAVKTSLKTTKTTDTGGNQ